MKKLLVILAGILLCAVLAGCNPYANYISPEDLGISGRDKSSASLLGLHNDYSTRQLKSIDWTVEVFESAHRKSGSTLFVNRYAISDGTSVYAVRVDGTNYNNSVLYHTAFDCGGDIYFYDNDTQEWTATPIASGRYQSLFAYVELDNGGSLFILLPKSFNRLENGVIEYLPGQDGYLSVTGEDGHWRLDVLANTEGQSSIQDCLVQVSSQRLLDMRIENIGTYWAKYANGKDALWCFDGYYRTVPDGYTPNKKNAYYRCVASYLPRTLTEIPDVLDTDISILIPMMDAIATVQNGEGYWETEPVSNWLHRDFKIGPGFYDTRFNTDLVNLYVKMDSIFGKGLFDETIDRYITFYQAMASENHTETENGGWLVEDYWYKNKHNPTHTSLNHQASECLLLFNLFKHYQYPDNNVTNDNTELSKAYKMRKLARLLLKAIEDTGEEWIMEDNNLYYSRSQDGTYTEGDYPQLTYTDLYYLQEYLAETNASRSETLDKLMKAKRIWMDENNVSNYLK